MKKLILLIVLLPSLASADKIIVGGLSHHFNGVYNTDYDFNEVHESIGYEGKWYEIGAYKNSVNRTSYFISRIDRPFKFKSGFSAGYRFGLASGYNDIKLVENGKEKTTTLIDGGIMPQAQFIISHESKYITLDLGLAPVSTLIFKVNL